MSSGSDGSNKKVRVKCIWCNSVMDLDPSTLGIHPQCPSCKNMTQFVEVSESTPTTYHKGDTHPEKGAVRRDELSADTKNLAESGTVIAGVYTLKKRIGRGGAAVIYAAGVNLDQFDYTTLYAYTQVQGENHARRRKKAEVAAATLAGQSISAETMRALLTASSIPMPEPLVALKLAQPNVHRDRFEAEWKNLLCLNHPNVVHVYGGGSFKGRLYYVMELLADIVEPWELKSKYTLRQRIESVIQGASGVGHLHQNGLIHRDLKPHNMVACKDAEGGLHTKVTDLGLGKNVHDDMELTQSAAFMGTPSYMSPEQMSSSRDVDLRTDIYSLGACLYEYASSSRPYYEQTKVFELIASVIHGEKPTPLSKVAPGLPPVLVSIINTAMAHDPAMRYASCEDLIHDLTRFLRQEDEAILSRLSFEEPAQEKSQAVPGLYVLDKIAGQGKSRRRKKKATKRKTGSAEPRPAVINCPYCFHDFPGVEDSCPECGKEVSWEALHTDCKVCGAEQPVGNAFCSKCGAGLKKDTRKSAHARVKLFRCYKCEHVLAEHQTWCPACGVYNGEDQVMLWLIGAGDFLLNLWSQFWPILAILAGIIFVYICLEHYDVFFDFTPEE